MFTLQNYNTFFKERGIHAVSISLTRTYLLHECDNSNQPDDIERFV